MIETYRYKDVALEDRLCQICRDKCVEDKQHFIGTCKALSHVRNNSKDRFREAEVDITKVNVQCIKSKLHSNCIKLTCDLLVELFEERKILIYDICENELDDSNDGDARRRNSLVNKNKF